MPLKSKDGHFNQLSVNVLSIVCSHFSLKGKDFSTLRLVNKKMKKAYERHFLSFYNITRLATELGP